MPPLSPLSMNPFLPNPGPSPSSPSIPASPLPLPSPGIPRLSRARARALSSTSAAARGQHAVLSRHLRSGLAYISALVRAGQAAFVELSVGQRTLVVVLFAVAAFASVLLLVFSHAIFAALAPVAKTWRALPGGWVLLWLLVFATAFPPLVGYSFGATLAGFVFGFPAGWPIVASAAVAGSLAAFMASRTVLSGYVDRLVGKDARFLALAQVLRRDGLLVLTMIRFCPLPFSLSNGFLATIPSISPWGFAVSTALSSPKLLVHVFLGSRIALLAEHGDTMTAGDKAINYLSMIMGTSLGTAVGFLIYRRTIARAAEIARQGGPGHGAALSASSSTRPSADRTYADLEAGLLDPADHGAMLMGDDDLSLWGVDDDDDLTYRDEDGEAGGGGGRKGVVGSSQPAAERTGIRR